MTEDEKIVLANEYVDGRGVFDANIREILIDAVMFGMQQTGHIKHEDLPIPSEEEVEQHNEMMNTYVAQRQKVRESNLNELIISKLNEIDKAQWTEYWKLNNYFGSIVQVFYRRHEYGAVIYGEEYRFPEEVEEKTKEY